MSPRRIFLLGCSVPALTVAAAQAAAPISDPSKAQSRSKLEEIVVTAQRRSEKLQKVPIAIVALPAGQLKASGVTSTQALATVVPSLSVATNGPSATLFIRGVGSDTGNLNQEPSVATYIDDIYIASPTQGNFALNNVAQVSVLKGPQGTLFGRNATGGVIQITTREPTATPHLDAEIGYANYNTTSGSLYAAGPLTQAILADLAIQGTTQGDGWGRSVVSGESLYTHQDINARSKFIWRPTNDTKVRLELDYDQGFVGGLAFRSLPGEVNADGLPGYVGFYNATTDTHSNQQRLTGGASLRVDQDFGDFRFASVTAYRQISDTYTTDEDKSALPIVDATLHQQAHNYSQEFQLLSAADSKLTWVVGAFLYNFDALYEPGRINGLSVYPLPYVDINSDSSDNSFSGYAQATAEILPNTHITGGLRYTIERQYETSSETSSLFGTPLLLAGPFHQSQGFDKATWRLGIDHQFTPDLLGYLTYNRGIKSGGFDMLTPGSPGYRPEQLDAYEVGAKSELLDHTLRLNASAFYYDYKNIQEELALTGGTVTVNSGEAHIYGVDVDLEAAVTSQLRVFASGSYLHSTFFRYPNASADPGDPGPTVSGIDAQGNITPQAPRYTGDVGATYTVPTPEGDFTANGVYSYNNGFFWDSVDRLTQPAYALINASIGWQSPNGKYGASFWGKNLGGAHYYAQQIESDGLGDLTLPAPPRTYGFTLSLHY
jgi:iron complex outermembrane receptor protein